MHTLCKQLQSSSKSANNTRTSTNTTTAIRGSQSSSKTKFIDCPTDSLLLRPHRPHRLPLTWPIYIIATISRVCWIGRLSSTRQCFYWLLFIFPTHSIFFFIMTLTVKLSRGLRLLNRILFACQCSRLPNGIPDRDDDDDTVIFNGQHFSLWWKSKIIQLNLHPYHTGNGARFRRSVCKQIPQPRVNVVDITFYWCVDIIIVRRSQVYDSSKMFECALILSYSRPRPQQNNLDSTSFDLPATLHNCTFC